jgi:hypothetical protein
VEQNTKESNRLADNQYFQEPIEQSLEKSGYKIFTPQILDPPLIPPSRWIAGGMKICAVSNFINTGIFLEGGDLGFFLYEKGSKGKKVLLQDM